MFSNKKECDAVYKPPHMRSDLNMPLINDDPKSKPNLKVKYIDHKYKAKNNNVTNLNSGEFFSKFCCLPPPRRKIYNFGLSSYFDNKYKGTTSEYKKKLEESTTLYVGNLNLLSTESDVQKLFSKCGKIKTIIMGVEKKTLAPGGFCFVEYETREAAEICIKTMQNYLLYGKNLIIDWDAGFVEGRQYSRNKLSQRPIVYYPF